MYFRVQSVQLDGKCAVWVLEIEILTNILDMENVLVFHHCDKIPEGKKNKG